MARVTTKGRAGKVAKKVPARSAVKSTKKVSPLAPKMRWVNTYLTVKNPAQAITFYRQGFGFRERSVCRDGNQINHAELEYKDCVIMLGPECPERNAKGPHALNGTPVTIYAYTENVDGVTARAREAGATVIEEPKNQFWGDRTAVVVDPEGHCWMWATHVKDVKPEDMKPPASEGCSSTGSCS